MKKLLVVLLVAGCASNPAPNRPSFCDQPNPSAEVQKECVEQETVRQERAARNRAGYTVIGIILAVGGATMLLVD